MTPTGAEIRQALNLKCASLGIPVSGNFELTPRCNLQCKMCYVRMTPEQMAPIGRERTAKEWIELAKEARDAGLAFLLLTGGEPTLRADFAEIYENLATMGLSISINTNGTMLTPEIRSLWHRLPPSQVNITLYRVCREDYQNLCGNGDAFDKVLDALSWLSEEGILTHLNTTITPQNYHRWLQLENFAKDRGYELRMTNYCFPPTRRAGCDTCNEFSRLAPEQVGELIVKDMLFREGPDAVRLRAKNLDSPLQRGCDLDVGNPIQCLAGRSQFWLTWDGRLTLCGMIDNPATHPFEEGFLNAWESLRSQSALIRLCPECTTCPDQKLCMNCAAVTYSETGRFDGKPEYMCQVSRAYKDTLQNMADKL